MNGLQTIMGSPEVKDWGTPLSHNIFRVESGALLGNHAIQVIALPTRPASAQAGGITVIGQFEFVQLVRPESRLARLKRHTFTPDGKSERVEKSIQALQQPLGIKLSSKLWDWIALDPEVEDQA